MMYLKRLCFLLSIILLFAQTVNGQTVDSNYVDGIVYVKVYNSSLVNLAPYNFSDPGLNSLYTMYGIDTITRPFPGLNQTLDNTYRIYFQIISQIDSLIYDLEQLSYIEYAEKAPLYKTSYVPNDLQASQWALAKINAVQAWDFTTGTGDVKIAIVDNAVSTSHEDLIDNIWVNPGEIPGNGFDDDLNGYIDDINGWDVADNDNNPNPPGSSTNSSPFVHGTHCAGIASSTSNNGTGIASIGFNARIIAVKCSNDSSSDEGASLPNAYDGVYYAIQAGADIISMSWGGASGGFLTGENLMNTANSLGITLIAAAGNNNSDANHYPAAYTTVISVGSTNQTDQKSSFSNYGAFVDVMAPGTSIYSTLSGTNNAYGYLSGTSMACPLVAGLASLILSVEPGFSPSQVKSALENGCDNIDPLNPAYAGQLGAGRINAYKSLQNLVGLHETSFGNITVYPNPIEKGSPIHFYQSSSENLQSLEIIDMKGSVILKIQLSDSPGDYAISNNLDSGIYQMLFMTDDRRYFMKRIVVK